MIVAGASVQGTAHLARGQGCQDAFKAVDLGGTAVLAVSDGAGSRDRSALGAHIAVDAACRLLTEGIPDAQEPPEAWTRWVAGRGRRVIEEYLRAATGVLGAGAGGADSGAPGADAGAGAAGTGAMAWASGRRAGSADVHALDTGGGTADPRALGTDASAPDSRVPGTDSPDSRVPGADSSAADSRAPATDSSAAGSRVPGADAGTAGTGAAAGVSGPGADSADPCLRGSRADSAATRTVSADPVAADLGALAATLTAAVVAPPWVAFVSLGDGFGTLLTRDDRCHLVLPPPAAPAAFLSSPGAALRVRTFAVWEPDLAGVVLSTDGCAALALDHPAVHRLPPDVGPLPAAGFFLGLAATLRENHGDAEPLRRRLSGPEAGRTGDDLTVVCALVEGG